MATSSYKSFLMHKASGDAGDWEKLVDITDYPDLGGEPEMLDATTLSDKMRVYVPGIQETEGMNFNANYEPDSYKALKALEGKEESYAVWLGGTETNGVATPTGSEGKFSFDGILSVYVKGAGVNEVRGMGITIAPTTVIKDDE